MLRNHNPFRVIDFPVFFYHIDAQAINMKLRKLMFLVDATLNVSARMIAPRSPEIETTHYLTLTNTSSERIYVLYSMFLPEVGGTM